MNINILKVVKVMHGHYKHEIYGGGSYHVIEILYSCYVLLNPTTGECFTTTAEGWEEVSVGKVH